MIGSASSLAFDVVWASERASGTAAEVTRGSLCAFLAGDPIWGPDGRGFSWTWIELLEHLAACWQWIELEEIDPLGLGIPPERLRAEALRRWEVSPSSQRDEEEDLLWAFEQRHNLASGIHGAWLPDLWLLRSGDEFRISSANREVWRSANEVLSTLNDLGEQIASRLATCNDERANHARLAWHGR